LIPADVQTILDGAYVNGWEILNRTDHEPVKKECSWDKRVDILLLFIPIESISDPKVVDTLLSPWKAALDDRAITVIPVITKADDYYKNITDPTQVPDDIAHIQNTLKPKFPRSAALKTYWLSNKPDVISNYLATRVILVALQKAVIKAEAPTFLNKLDCCVSEQYLINIKIYLNAVDLLTKFQLAAFAHLLWEGSASLGVLFAIVATFILCRILKNYLGDPWFLHHCLTPVYSVLFASLTVIAFCGCS